MLARHVSVKVVWQHHSKITRFHGSPTRVAAAPVHLELKLGLPNTESLILKDIWAVKVLLLSNKVEVRGQPRGDRTQTLAHVEEPEVSCVFFCHRRWCKHLLD